ncbi:hypothetical protein Tco_0199068 [Tanacetum coccineum]
MEDSVKTRAAGLNEPSFILVRNCASICIGEFRKDLGPIIAWVDLESFVWLVLLTGANNSACMCTHSRLMVSNDRKSLPSVPDAYVTVAMSGVLGDGSRVHTHDHDRSEAPDESLDLILSSEPKPLGKHRPPPPPSILSPGESSYPP